MGAVLVVLAGAIGSVLAARVQARADGQKAQHAFATTSAGVTSNLRLALQHEADLLQSTTAFIVATPNISNTKFNEWVKADSAFARYPEMVALVRIAFVRAAELPAFAARVTKDPAGTLAPDGSFQVLPPGNRPFYCFTDLTGKSPTPTAPGPAGADLCSQAFRARLLAARDAGVSSYEPFALGKIQALGIQIPLFRGGAVPATLAARRAAFTGWVAFGLMPQVILRTALLDHPQTAVTLRYARGTSAATFAAGSAPHGAQTITVPLRNGWTVRTSAAVGGSSVFAYRDATAILIGGIALSLLLGLLGIVLATGRARALRLVRKQTLELNDQAAMLRGTVTELEAAHSVKDEFLALVSHELRSPLTSIRGYAELLQEEDLGTEQHAFVDVIERSGTRLLSLVEDLLLMAEIQSGGLPLDRCEVILNDLIASSSEAAQPFATSKDIELNVDSEPGVATDGDPMRLGQVIDNLVSNAIKYTPNGGDVSVTMTRKDDIATIAVSDTGIGIPKGEEGQMFDRFFRTSNARDAGIQGTGLGLAITRGIVEAHGGTIGFDSVEGAGTTFVITLPLAHAVGLESVA